MEGTVGLQYLTKIWAPSKRSQRPNRNRYARLWAIAWIPEEHMYKPISMDTLATLRTNGGSGLKEYTGAVGEEDRLMKGQSRNVDRKQSCIHHFCLFVDLMLSHSIRRWRRPGK